MFTGYGVMGTVLDCGARASRYEHFRKQYDNLREIKKGEGDKRSPLTQDGRENLSF